MGILQSASAKAGANSAAQAAAARLPLAEQLLTAVPVVCEAGMLENWTSTLPQQQPGWQVLTF